MTIAFIRGQYINNFELQSYYPMLEKHDDIKITGFSSLKPKHQVKIPIQKLASPADIPDFPYKLPILNRLCLGDAMYLWGLEKKLKSFDLAHVRETYFHFSSQAVYAKKKGIINKILVTCSETIPFNHETIWGRKGLKQNVRTYTDHFHCLSQKAKQCLVKEGISEEKITVIPYGVDLKIFKSMNQKKNSNKIKGLFIGRLEKQKGIYELIQIYKKIRAEFTHFELSIVGSGPAQKELKNIGITPKSYPYSQIPEIMNEADLLILPSKADRFWEEYLGMVLLEAMACGLPILTTDCGAIPEVVSDCALIVKQSSAKDLYQGLKKMIMDKSLLSKLSEMGRDRVLKHFDSAKQSEKLYLLYNKIMKQK